MRGFGNNDSPGQFVLKVYQVCVYQVDYISYSQQTSQDPPGGVTRGAREPEAEDL